MELPEAQNHACLAAIESFLKKRRPQPEIRHKLDIKAELCGTEVIISEIRPRYNEPEICLVMSSAKVKWIGTQKRWKLYWHRKERWTIYEPGSHLTDIQAIFDEIDRDPHGCFWG